MFDVNIASFMRGDDAAVHAAMRAYSPQLKAIVWPFAQDPDDAKDLLQETWIRAYQKRHTYDGEGSLLGWLIVVCRNVCIDNARVRASRSSLLPQVLADLSAERPHQEAEDRIAAHDPQRVAKALAQLPPRQRAALTLRLIEGRSTREAAEAMNCAEGSVKAHLHHALKTMRTLLEEPHHELPGR